LHDRFHIKILAALILTFLSAAPRAFASGAATIDVYNAAGVSFPTLDVPVGVRAIGMGDAYTAAGNDVYALNWNPAGMAKMSGFELGLADNEWAPALGIRQEFLTYGQSMGQGSALGVSFNYFNLGTLDQRDGITGALDGQSSAIVFSGNAGYAWSMLDQDKLKLGFTVEFAMESFLGSSLDDFGGSLGALYDVTHDLSLGLSINHLGSGTGGFSPPEAVNAGVATQLYDKKLVLDLDASVPFSSEPFINVGGEYKPAEMLALRAGYRYALGAEEGDVQSGLSAAPDSRRGFSALITPLCPMAS
jgi:long-subunit fatty acid transport protein